MAAYYFAYGSNLNRRQFASRCPNASAISRLTLPDFQLVFRRVADIVDAPGKKVEGAVYRITPCCEAALDRYEGFPHLYYKRSFAAEIGSGRNAEVIDVMFYVMRDRDIAPPPQSYLDTIEKGYDDWSIPHASLNAAVKSARRRGVEYLDDPRRYGTKKSVIRGRRDAVPGEPAYRQGLAETHDL